MQANEQFVAEENVPASET